MGSVPIFAMSLLTEELKSWIGREAHYPAHEELGRASIRYFALAMGDDAQEDRKLSSARVPRLS